MLDYFDFALLIFYRPGRLHTESRLEIGFRAFKIAEHKYACPRLYGNAGCQLSAGEGYCPCNERIAHRINNGLYRIKTYARFYTGADVYLIALIVIVVLALHKKIVHRKAGRYARQKP